MGVNKYCSGFWVGLTAALSVIFAVLFFRAVRGNYSLMQSILLTATGVVVIWVVYFVRAAIFTRIFGSDRDDSDKHKDA